MADRLFGGNGSSKCFTSVTAMGPGWVVIHASQSNPPPPDMLPYVLSQTLEQWSKSQPNIRIRAALPINKDGNTIGIHVWFDAD
jgi:hypothetical protein